MDNSSSACAAAKSLIGQFCDMLKFERNMSDHTIRAYRIDLETYLEWCERNDIDPLDVNHKILRHYLGDLDRADYARTTVNRRLSSLRSYYQWLNVIGRIDYDPSSILRGPKQNEHLPNVISPNDMVALLLVHSDHDKFGNVREQTPSDIRDQAILELLYASGARVSEVSNLQLADVDLLQQQVKVFGKGRKERIIPLHDLCVDSMRSYLYGARDMLLRGKKSPYFFVSTRGNQMKTDALRKMFKATVRAAGLDESLSPHDMRHTFATDLLNGGADLRSVQEMLGHVSLSTTQIYTHLSVDRLKDAHKQSHPRG